MYLDWWEVLSFLLPNPPFCSIVFIPRFAFSRFSLLLLSFYCQDVLNSFYFSFFGLVLILIFSLSTVPPHAKKAKNKTEQTICFAPLAFSLQYSDPLCLFFPFFLFLLFSFLFSFLFGVPFRGNRRVKSIVYSLALIYRGGSCFDQGASSIEA